MFAILYTLGVVVADLVKSRARLEADVLLVLSENSIRAGLAS
jgi:hypothetical protein